MGFTRRLDGGSMERNQTGISEKFADYFRGKARPNPKETLCIRVLSVGRSVRHGKGRWFEIGFQP